MSEPLITEILTGPKSPAAIFALIESSPDGLTSKSGSFTLTWTDRSPLTRNSSASRVSSGVCPVWWTGNTDLPDGFSDMLVAKSSGIPNGTG